MAGNIELNFDFRTHSAAATSKQRSDAYRFYVIGHFSGNGNSLPWQQRKLQKIDCDNFDSVMAQMMPKLAFDNGATLAFNQLEAFHPDHWLKSVPLIADLLDLKKQLSQSSTAAAAAARIDAFLPNKPETVPVPKTTTTETQGDMFDRLLGKRPESSAEQNDSLQSMLEQMLAPHITHDVEPQYRQYGDAVDRLLSQCLCAFLHNPDFQRLESLWLAVSSLVNEQQADEQGFYLCDVSASELSSASDEQLAAFAQRLQAHVQRDDETSKVILVCDHELSDVGLFRHCCQLASAVSGLLFGYVRPEAMTDRFVSIAGNRFVASYPRYLQRLPYGAKRDALSSFDFEECPEIPKAEALLWGNPAFLAARSLLKPDDNGFFADIPAFSYTEEGAPLLQPGTENVLTEAQAEALMAQGVNPVLGFRHRQGVRLLGIRSVANLIGD